MSDQDSIVWNDAEIESLNAFSDYSRESLSLSNVSSPTCSPASSTVSSPSSVIAGFSSLEIKGVIKNEKEDYLEKCKKCNKLLRGSIHPHIKWSEWFQGSQGEYFKTVGGLKYLWHCEWEHPVIREDFFGKKFDLMYKKKKLLWKQDYFHDATQWWMCDPDNNADTMPLLYDYFCFRNEKGVYITPIFRKGVWWFPCGPPEVYERWIMPWPNQPERYVAPHFWLTLPDLVPMHLKNNKHFVEELVKNQWYDKPMCDDFNILSL